MVGTIVLVVVVPVVVRNERLVSTSIVIVPVDVLVERLLVGTSVLIAVVPVVVLAERLVVTSCDVSIVVLIGYS